MAESRCADICVVKGPLLCAPRDVTGQNAAIVLAPYTCRSARSKTRPFIRRSGIPGRIRTKDGGFPGMNRPNGRPQRPSLAGPRASWNLIPPRGHPGMCGICTILVSYRMIIPLGLQHLHGEL
ncbi:hypothetical protein SKAU_G00015900 [Synaphobranchus kaupii]|uniref:Uncharacterized protein n=1 Tax=Synaphobranchus kaupii TaxID=118154 RepID=A0A9Q1GB71_SYNKA|nr:hypothetical protein SKAU_G00015900 [Synaphobranchus kaupii]